MSKNIIELIKDQIKIYDKTEKSPKIKVPTLLLWDKISFVFTTSEQILIFIGALTHKDPKKPYQERLFEVKSIFSEMGKGEIEKKEKEISIKANEILREFRNQLSKGIVVPDNEFLTSPSVDYIENLLVKFYYPGIILGALQEKKMGWEYPKNPENIRKECINIINSFLSEEYKTPQYPTNIYQHLVALYIFYFSLALIKIPATMLSKIDFVMTRLVYHALWTTFEVSEFGRESYRIEKGKIAIKKAGFIRKQPVLEAYYRIDKTGIKPHKIATTIRKYLEKTQKVPPSVDTIKRYLKAENLI
jgi:hypothetical protein